MRFVSPAPEASLWLAAALVGVTAMRWMEAGVAPLVAIAAAPVVAWSVYKRAVAAVIGLSGAIGGVMGYWFANLVWWDWRCGAPLGPGEVLCSRFGEPQPSLTLTAIALVCTVLVAVGAAWVARRGSREA